MVCNISTVLANVIDVRESRSVNFLDVANNVALNTLLIHSKLSLEADLG